MTTTLTAVATSGGVFTDNLTVAVDTASLGTPPSRTQIEQALDAALLVTNALTLDEVSARLGIPATTVTRYAGDGDLTAMTVTGEEGTPLFPDWQFTNTTRDGVLPYLGAVLHRVSSEVSPMVLSRWMTTPHPALTVGNGMELSPHMWLLYVGEPGPVLDIAADVGVSEN